MKFRPHCGGLDESMRRARVIEPTAEAIAANLSIMLSTPVKARDIQVKPYTFDERIGWDTHLVTWQGRAVGYTDAPLADA